jgi:lysophospholipase L1-like esterase
MARNWVFLGDSLTEGVGSKRISHVTELVKQLRSSKGMNVHEFRLRHVDNAFNKQIDFNVAGLIDVDADQDLSDLWLWNLACEGQTIDADFGWLSLIAALRPERVVIFRGSLESIIRPAMVQDGDWPWWVPQSWRSYAAMDPRCYFSTTWWRKAKQGLIDGLKQRVRLKLLRRRPGKPLLDLEGLASYQTELLRRLRAMETRVFVLGLLPVDEARFPGSREHFKMVNARLKQIANAEGVEFFDWASSLNGSELFYRDGFHPSPTGAARLARLLHERIL